MADELSLFNPPKNGHKRAASSIRSVRSTKSTSSKASTASDKSHYCDLLGIRTKDKGPADNASSSRLSTIGSIASGTTASSTTSNASAITDASAVTNASAITNTSAITNASSKSSKSSKSAASMTEHDVFGTRLPPTEEELAPSAPDAVELESGKYQVPASIGKQFFRDLTFLADEELISKYDLLQVVEAQDGGVEEKKKGGGKFKRIVRDTKIGMARFVVPTGFVIEPARDV